MSDNPDDVGAQVRAFLMDGLRGDASKKSNIRQSVRSGRERLATIRSEIALIKEYRDQRLAHVDRIRVNRGLDEGSAVAVTTLRTVFECVGEVVAQQRLVLEGPERTASHNDLLGQIMEPRGLSDLLYFARIAVADVNIQDPSIHAQRLRSLERSLREVEVDLRSADPRMP